ncbi:ABC transporter ATP-binding protein [Paraburkholderia sartisoli]|uniref:Amino acid/amide ABC transporter ATP-binding protein 1, HAAT family n=1 Tax=Paraburkholderia sartisoli TaxID=83784 RepID=A0A1H4GU47_9BURK|nr:ABC transporter ATP-binding protein [Paraburkholderia sartisoli]SEB12152.1 amino acid/amide ABC transporter ATP-binding protein 1, HAAT family [Paraburkholderia sartisoli]
MAIDHVLTDGRGPLLQTHDLTKAYGGLLVTDHVSLTLEAGARHAVLGPNGAGKSTLVGLLSGVVESDSGKIMLMGRDITRTASAARVRHGLVRTFQISNLFPRLTVLDNVLVAVCQRKGGSYRLLRSVSGHRDYLDSAEGVLEQLGLIDDRWKLAEELAYGRQRLLEMAIALSLHPKVLLLDEPAAGVPGSETGVIIDAMEKLPRDIAILTIEHDMNVVRRFATSVTILAAGRIMVSGAVHDIMASEDVRALYLGRSGHARFAKSSST